MSEPYEKSITSEQRKLILRQKVFFVGTAGPTGTVNISPRGHESLRILNEQQVAWIDYHGSGNETALHLDELNRITLMFCDLEETSATVRIFGEGSPVLPQNDEFQLLLKKMGFDFDPIIRQIFLVNVLFTSNSCGSGVPVYKYECEGSLVEKWKKVHSVGKFNEVTAKVSALPRPVMVLEDPEYFDEKK